jgi:hypothetical protein
MMDIIADCKGIILDLRNYPRIDTWEILSYLTSVRRKKTDKKFAN